MAATGSLDITIRSGEPTTGPTNSIPARASSTPVRDDRPGASDVVRYLEVQRCVDSIAEQLQRAAFYRASLHGACPDFKTLMPGVQETFKRIARAAIARTSVASHREAEVFAERTCSTPNIAFTNVPAVVRAYHEDLERQFTRHPIFNAGEGQ